MRRVSKLALAGIVAFVFSGCVIHTGPSRGRVVSSKRGGGGCPPSHHWDGYHCIHNGKGHGARKHDY